MDMGKNMSNISINNKATIWEKDWNRISLKIPTKGTIKIVYIKEGQTAK